jgi:uncharacterized membrane protein
MEQEQRAEKKLEKDEQKEEKALLKEQEHEEKAEEKAEAHEAHEEKKEQKAEEKAEAHEAHEEEKEQKAKEKAAQKQEKAADKTENTPAAAAPTAATKPSYLEAMRQAAEAEEQRHSARIARDLEGVPGSFAHGLNFYKMFWVFFICCFLGVVIETIFCFFVTGHWEQRTGLVWGPFNLIYGFGAVILTLILHPFIGKKDRWIFLGGAIIGGAFEYFCSWIQQKILGTVSWDYSSMPFNLDGRINLLFCLFWGALALVWVKDLFPIMSGFIERHLPKSWGLPLTWVLVVFMAANSLVSGMAVLRESQRYDGIPATAEWQRLMDEWYPDSTLDKIYPSMQRVDTDKSSASTAPVKTERTDKTSAATKK